MAIRVQCRKCAAAFGVKDHLEGKMIRCPKCKNSITVQQDALNAEEPADEATAAESPPSPKKADRPTSARVPAGSSRLRVILFSIGGVVGLLFVCCMGVFVYLDVANKNAKIYNDKMAVAQRNSDTMRVRFEEDIQNCLHFGSFDQARMREVRDHHKRTHGSIAGIRSEMANWEVPGSAAALHEQFEKYIQFEQDSLSKYHKVISIMENNELTAEQKRTQSYRILDEIDAEGKAQISELRRLQQEFTRAHGIFVI